MIVLLRNGPERTREVLWYPYVYFTVHGWPAAVAGYRSAYFRHTKVPIFRSFGCPYFTDYGFGNHPEAY